MKQATPETDQPFTLIRLLGTGGFAQTWLARIIDPDLAEEWRVDEVAVKIPLSKAKEAVLKKEIELNGSLYLRLSEIESRNICRYLGFAVYDNKVVMVMEYVAGGSLRQKVGRPGSGKILPPDTAVSLMHGILSGLAIIHQNQIVHRDIKPENVLIRDGAPQISDLGIGRMLRQNEIASTTVGTIFYMPPEMLLDKSESCGASFYSDIWSVGITFYEMLCGTYPFGIQLDAPLATIIRKITDSAVPLTFPADSAVPERLRRIVAKALQRNPALRYQNASEMLAALEQLTLSEDQLLDQTLAAWQSCVLTPELIQEITDQLPVLLSQYPASSKLYQFIGEFYNKCGQYDKALEAFRSGISLSDSPAMLYWGLAMAYEKKKDLSAARHSLEQALTGGLEKSHARYAQIMLDSLRRKMGGDPS